MTDESLLRLLRSVGMTAFVEHLDLFKSGLSGSDAATELQSQTGWTSSACKTRVSKARSILAQGHEKDALRLIIASKLPAALREAARRAL
jgi:hypothetical protein